MDILEKRKRKKNILLNDIKNIEKSIANTEEKIKRIQSSCFDSDYIEKETNELKDFLELKNLDLIEKNEKLLLISSGELDLEIEDEYTQTKQKIEEDDKKTKDKKHKKSEESLKNKKISKQYSDNIFNDRQIHKQNERDIKYSYRYFRKIVDSIPDYMKKKLSEMPNNKGYIWRGIFLYGELEDDNSNTNVLFEKVKGNILYIHEYHRNEYIKYEKVGNNKKRLLFRKPKLNKNKDASLFDYIKK